jgi:hypothetical protein
VKQRPKERNVSGKGRQEGEKQYSLKKGKVKQKEKIRLIERLTD